MKSEHRLRRLQRRLASYTPPTIKAPSFSQFCRAMSFPAGDFEWNQDEAGDWHASRDDDSWTQYAYFFNFYRRDDNGKVCIEVRDCDRDGSSDVVDSFEQGGGTREWRQFWREWLGPKMTDDYFKGWAEYHLDCAEEGTDPLGAFFNPTRATVTAHLDAAEDHLDSLLGATRRTRRAHRRAHQAHRAQGVA